MSSKVKINGKWIATKGAYVKHNGKWVSVKSIYQKHNGKWVKVSGLENERYATQEGYSYSCGYYTTEYYNARVSHTGYRNESYTWYSTETRYSTYHYACACRSVVVGACLPGMVCNRKTVCRTCYGRSSYTVRVPHTSTRRVAYTYYTTERRSRQVWHSSTCYGTRTVYKTRKVWR